MGVRIMHGVVDGRQTAVWVDSVTDTAFGPVFDSYEDSFDFLEYFRENDIDPRSTPFSSIRAMYKQWSEGRIMQALDYLADELPGPPEAA
jgi:hypothetical protein